MNLRRWIAVSCKWSKANGINKPSLSKIFTFLIRTKVLVYFWTVESKSKRVPLLVGATLKKISLTFVFLCFTLTAIAAPKFVRWTGEQDKNSDLSHVLDVIRAKTGLALSLTDLMLLEDRALATSHFTMLLQTAAKIPIRFQNIRIWTSPSSGEVIQVEARVDEPPPSNRVRFELRNSFLSSARTMELLRSAVLNHPDDREMRSVDWMDYWEKNALIRVVKAKGRRGTHTIIISLAQKTVSQYSYQEYPQADELSIAAQIYPIYEEVEDEGTLLPRVASELRYIKSKTAQPSADPYLALLSQRYPGKKSDPVLGLTVEGRKQGLWAMSYVRSQAAALLAQVPLSPNTFDSGKVVLEGRYATINLHPNVPAQFQNLSFTPQRSAQFKPDWKPMPENPEEWEMLPGSGVLGRPIASAEEAWNRPARRLPDHDPSSYINDGFDELQVYWAINQMFDSLRPMGFVDPELSTRRFHAYLYDPEIVYRDNAYYTDDTINFTTYSPKQPNMARDNTTIWHELGHGVMDRMMGDHIRLADTGGLSEGMADFIAQLVLGDVTGGKNFPGKEKLRIFNNTGFYLTNEVHDDGEAYGGSMNDLLETAVEVHGRAGLTKVTDLTLEAMRLTRNHPGLTAVDWFEHMLFADELGHRPVREPGELSALIVKALAGRNFNLDGAVAASFTLKNGDEEVTSTGPGSRENPIRLHLEESETASYQLKINLKSTPTYGFVYPVTVKVAVRGGPLQGAIHWNGEEENPFVYQLASEADAIVSDLTVTGKCDEVNRPDGSCVDYAYVQIWNSGAKRPVSKKRFYLRMHPANTTSG